MTNSSIHQIIHFFTGHKTSEPLKRKFWHWLVASEDEAAKEGALDEVWRETAAEPDADTRKSLEAVKLRIGLKRKASQPELTQKTQQPISLQMRKFLRIAAILTLPLIMAAASWLYVDHRLSASEMLECSVPMGEHRELLLPDGTKATINSGSMLVYPKNFHGDTRTIFLSGEACFEVHKDARHPFIVKTTQIAVQALGTKFNVNAYSDCGKTTTILENGSVLVSGMANPEQRFILKPDEQLEFDHYTRTFEKKPVDARLSTGWTHGQLNFVNQSLKEIINALQRHYKVTIAIDSRLNTSDLYTIKLRKNETLAKVLDILKQAIGETEVRFVNANSVELTVSGTSAEKGGSRHK